MRFCAHPLRVESVSYSLLTLQYASPAGLEIQTFWGLIFLVQHPQAGEPNVGLNPSLLGENLCNCNYSPICGSLTQGYESWLYHVSAPPMHLIMVPFLYLQLCQCLGCSHRPFSVNRCYFCVPMGGGELKVFLLSILATSPLFSSLYFISPICLSVGVN